MQASRLDRMPIATSTQSAATKAADRNAKDVVIYDGHCRLCSAQMRRLASLDWTGKLAYLSLHDPAVTIDYPDLKHDDLMREMVVVDCQGNRHPGANAVRYLSRRLPALWIMAPLLHIPGSLPLWRGVYRFIATHRYLLGNVEACDSDSCRLHR